MLPERDRQLPKRDRQLAERVRQLPKRHERKTVLEEDLLRTTPRKNNS